jgi:hypothetical protein
MLSVGILAFFTLLPIFELWAIRELGFDVLAYVKIEGKRNNIAFICVQPLVLYCLFKDMIISVIQFIAKNL